MNVNYDNFAKSFAKSRKNMKWAELEYFFSWVKQGSILDIWCGSGRLLEEYDRYFWNIPKDYLGIDLSQDLLHEAKKSFPGSQFILWDMRKVWNICKWTKFQNIFLIASFHHLGTMLERQELFNDLYHLLDANGKIYLTNWALNSSLNHDKYIWGQIKGSENEFWWSDYHIKIGSHDRFYHCFSLKELELLSITAWFKLLENRLFEWERNIITILEK